MTEVEARFVTAPEFSGSGSRPVIGEGFERWLAMWGAVQDTLSVTGLLRSLWISGSFVSAALDPGDIDVTPFVDAVLTASRKGVRGAGVIQDLVGHRSKVSATYRVEPFVVWWRPVGAILRTGALTPEEREYLTRRGAMDDLWQRVRPPGPKGPLTADSAVARRGYVEVIL